MSKTMKKVSALLLALLMIVTFMPMTQESAYAAAKKPGKVKGLKVKVSGKKMTISWKKAKNAKKYAVTIKDNTTKLKATKTTKKNKLKVTGQWSTKYSISVKGVNGKKKGKAAKKSAKIGKNPADTKADDEKKAAEQKAADAEKKAADAEQKAADAEKKATEAEQRATEAEQKLAEAQTAADNAKEAKEAAEKAAAEAEAKAGESEEAKEAAEKAKAKAEEAKENYEALVGELEEVQDAYRAQDKKERNKLKKNTELTLETWNWEVSEALNSMIYAHSGEDGDNYVVFDFDNTCSIFDVEEQLAVYQLQIMAFDETMTPEKLEEVLWTGLNADGDEALGETYSNWIHDIVAAYGKLLENYGDEEDGVRCFHPTGILDEDGALDTEKIDEMQGTDDWKEFATKMRAMYDLVYDNESAAVAYPWVLYWFTGMSHDEVYDLAYESHDTYRVVPTKEVTWESPADYPDQKAGKQEVTWTYGTQVSQNIVELMAALKNNGIDVWVCSASAVDPIRAAVDVWGLHGLVKGVMAMTNVYDYDKDEFVNDYDYATGYAWSPKWGKPGVWNERDDLSATEAQTQGKGKVIAIQNVCGEIYGKGPIAGFMDSTGDFNFCTEFKDLEVVCCFNRASRKVTDGGGLVAEVACYQGDTNVTYETRPVIDEETGMQDVLYVLQGREENGLRDLRPSRATMLLGAEEEKLFKNEQNEQSYEYFKNKKLAVKDIMNTYSIETAADDPKNKLGFKYGWFKDGYDGYKSQSGDIMDNLDKKLELDSWNSEVKEAINSMILANRTDAEDGHKYVVFDFDNTCSIFDVEEQLAVYQLQHMAFAKDMTPEKLGEVLATGLKEAYFTDPAKASKDYCENPKATYQDWIDDIVYAYDQLLKSDFAKKDVADGEVVKSYFTPEGLSEEDAEAIQKTADWKEFATKMRAMYDCVFDSESADVAYPWVLYWFTGMTHDEVYDLAFASHSFYKDVETSSETWFTPEDYNHGLDEEDKPIPTKIGAIGELNDDNEFEPVGYSWTSGTAVSENIVELMAALDANGIDVWVCSASATDPIRAAIDVWGLHPYVTGMMAMTNVYDEVYVNDYDYETGYACIPTEPEKDEDEEDAATLRDDWTYGEVATEAQTQGVGKSIAVENVLVSQYGMGPIAGFMDSTGDFNFCTEFKDLQVVCCFNRANRKVTDGGGLVAEVAVYENDPVEEGGLGYNYAKAKAAGDTLYVLQGRDENGLRGLRPARETLRLKKTTPALFRDENNFTQLAYFEDNEMTVEDIFNTFSIFTAADDKDNPFPFKYGWFENGYIGYHER